MSLANRTIALAEGRQLEELVHLLEKEGATALRCPLLSILDAPDDAPLLAWLDRLQAGEFAWVVLLTGEGLRRLLGCADRHGKRDAVIAAFAKTKTITRGPKPARALKEINLAPTITAQAPTTDGVIASLRSVNLQGMTVGVQLYSESNPPLEQYLRDARATPITVQPYIYAPAADADHILALLQRMAAGAVDAIVFTSSPQIDRLFEVAEERQQGDLLRQALAKTLVAAVGPLVQDNLQKRGVTVRVCPEQGWVMKNLVQQLKRVMSEAQESEKSQFLTPAP
ncbi:MAG: uroporphyrinogen-III synthase [Gemmataceae bacterium]|nr:uroporphyrinogen-III synthase [Gemmataceae bacterium]